MTDQPYPPTSPNVPPAVQPGPTAPLKTGRATAALVFGVVALFSCPLIGIVAIVLGITALSRAGDQPQHYGGRGMAIGGIVCGGASFVTIAMVALMASILLPSLSRARELSKQVVCAVNMGAIGTALRIYADDYPDQGLPSLDLLVELDYVTEKQLVCPSSEDEPGDHSYIFVPYDPSQPLDDDAVIMYESKSNHEDEGGNFLFADGHVEFESSENYDRLIESIRTRGP